MNDAQKTVLNLTSAALFGSPASVPTETDWQAVYDEIKKQELVSLLFPLTSNIDIPEDILKIWSEDRGKYLLNNARNISAHFTIQKLMDSAGIPCVILKGVASGSYYPDYLTRAYGDVDFLVPDNYYKRTDALLRKTGYEYVNRHDKHLIFSRGGILYELHKDIVGLPSTSIKKVFYAYLADIFDSSAPFEHRGLSCMIPSDRHHCVILLVHTAYHLANEGIGLRHLCDWGVFVGSIPDSFFEDELREILKGMGLWHFAEVLTCLCTEYLGLRKCGWADSISKEYLAALIDDIFKSGTFGHIHDEAVLQDSGLKAKASDLFSGKTVKAFFTSLNRGARTVLPASSEHPILLPAGWIFVTGRYIARVLKGKRSATKVGKNIVRIGKRQELTEEWRLFERRRGERQL